MWYHQESNRGHKDFQSFALPTELWYHFRLAGANIRLFLILQNPLRKKTEKKVLILMIDFNILLLSVGYVLVVK